jgi:hypothetical protein
MASSDERASTLAGKVLWHVTMSLDGRIAGPDEAMDWVFRYDSGPNAEVDETLRTLGAVLVGTRSNGRSVRRCRGVRAGSGRVVSSFIQNPAPGAPVPPILPSQDAFLFLDKSRFQASFAADVGADVAAFMAGCRRVTSSSRSVTSGLAKSRGASS